MSSSQRGLFHTECNTAACDHNYFGSFGTPEEAAQYLQHQQKKHAPEGGGQAACGGGAFAPPSSTHDDLNLELAELNAEPLAAPDPSLPILCRAEGAKESQALHDCQTER